MDNISVFFQIFNLNGKSPVLDQLMIFGATSLIYLASFLALALGFKGGIKEKKTALLIFLGLAIAFILIRMIHLFIHEPRPFATFHFLPIVPEPTLNSFPSIHTTIISIIAFSFTYFKSRWNLLFLPVMIWIGLSRVYVGVHYPLDIIGGFATAIVALIIAAQIKRIIISRIYPSL